MRLQFINKDVGLFWIKRMYFPSFCLIGAFIYAVQRWGDVGILPSWAAHYVNDFLCMPIVLYICQIAVRTVKSNRHLNITLPPILLLTLFYSLYFEVYLPTVNDRYTADPMDVFLYILGATFFYLMESRTNSNGSSKATWVNW